MNLCLFGYGGKVFRRINRIYRIVFKQVEQEMQENSWRFASAPHTSVSPVLHAKIL